MKNFELLRKIFLFWQEIAIKYETIKSNPEKREKDVSLGITSLSMSIIGAIVAIAFAYFAFKCFIGYGDAITETGLERFFAVIGSIVGGIVCALIALTGFVNLILASFVYARYQRKLNKKKIGTIALIVSILMCIGTIVAVIVLAIKLFTLIL